MKNQALKPDGTAEEGAKIGATKRALLISFGAIFAGIVGGMYLIEALWIGPETKHAGLIALAASTGVVLLAIEIARRTPLGKYLP